MSSQNAYECDAPECHELTHRDTNERFPKTWPRLTVQVGDAKTSGSFHDDACALEWAAKQLGTVWMNGEAGSDARTA